MLRDRKIRYVRAQLPQSGFSTLTDFGAGGTCDWFVDWASCFAFLDRLSEFAFKYRFSFTEFSILFPRVLWERKIRYFKARMTQSGIYFRQTTTSRVLGIKLTLWPRIPQRKSLKSLPCFAQTFAFQPVLSAETRPKESPEPSLMTMRQENTWDIHKLWASKTSVWH